MDNKDFISIDKNHSFTVQIIDNTAYFMINTLNPEKYKTFLLLLKSAFEYMVSKNVSYVKQQINKDDKENFKNSSFIEADNILVVKTHINDFMIEICDALGMHRL
jgi:hypothetical protein